MVRLMTLCLLLMATGCASRGNATRTSIFIDDARTSQGFQIATVDGQLANRWHSPVMTMVPYVLVEPGRHTFTLDGTVETFVAEVENGKRYRTDIQSGIPGLVEVVLDGN